MIPLHQLQKCRGVALHPPPLKASQRTSVQGLLVCFLLGLAIETSSPPYSSIIQRPRGFTHALAGRRSEAEALLKELQDLGKERYLSPAFIAGIYAGLGQKDEAFRSLEEAFRLPSRYLVWLKVAPEYELLRSDPNICPGTPGLLSLVFARPARLQSGAC